MFESPPRCALVLPAALFSRCSSPCSSPGAAGEWTSNPNLQAAPQTRQARPWSFGPAPLELPPTRITTPISSCRSTSRGRRAAIRQHAAGQSHHRRGSHARTRAVLRHAAVGEQHGLVRLVPRAEVRVRGSEARQPRVRGRHDRPSRDEPGQSAVSPPRPVFLGRARQATWSRWS